MVEEAHIARIAMRHEERICADWACNVTDMHRHGSDCADICFECKGVCSIVCPANDSWVEQLGPAIPDEDYAEPPLKARRWVLIKFVVDDFDRELEYIKNYRWRWMAKLNWFFTMTLLGNEGSAKLFDMAKFHGDRWPNE